MAVKTLDEIIQIVTSNEMRDVTFDRVKQIAREYATEVAKQVLHDAAENARLLLTIPSEQSILNTKQHSTNGNRNFR